MSEHCGHPDFVADVDVIRLSSDEGGPITSFAADVRISCHVCGLQFVFVCPDMGVMPDRPAVNADGTVMHLPLAPADRPEMRSEVGYRIRASGAPVGKRHA